MPTYEYGCRRCNHVFEKRMTVEEKKNTKTACPNCGSDDVRQQSFGVSFSSKNNTRENSSGGCCGGGGTGCCG